jgi:D-glycero-alpha-D-manno-heptose-7-phosphate kinase
VIITRTPVRISFLGGGTDYPDHFRRHGGGTLGVAIDRFSYLTVSRVQPFFEYSIRVSYSRTELCSSVDEIQHPAVRECLRFMGIENGIEIHYLGDLPARTGLGSSSSFTVGLLHALHALEGRDVGPEELARQAVHVEQDLIQERVGVQDQYTCAVGGMVHLDLRRDGTVRVVPVEITPERTRALQSTLLLFYTGVSRHAHAILEPQIEDTRAGKLDRQLGDMGALVAQGLDVLAGNGPVLEFGELLHAAWQIKKGLSSSISTPLIDDLYGRARGAGVVGGKILGAGGGGFLLLCADPDKHAAIERALAPHPRVLFSFEPRGTSVVFCV